MKKSCIILLILITSISIGLWAQTAFTATYTFGSNGNVASFTYNGTTYAGVTPGTMDKVGVTTSGSTGNFRATGWPLGATNGSNTFTGSVDTGKYIGFTLSAAAGYKFTVSSITFGVGRSGTGTRQSQWRGSSDSYASVINNYTTLATNITNASGVLTNPDDTGTTYTGNVLTISSGYSDITTSCGFRYYLFNSEASAGTAGLQGAITISGTYQESLASQPTAQPTSLSFSNVGSGSFDVSFTAASGSPAGYLAVRRAGAAPTTDPSDGSAYTAGTSLGNGTVAFSGSGTSFSESSLNPNTTYYYKIYSFNGSAGTTNYLITSPLEGSQATTSGVVAPTVTTTAITSVTTNSASGGGNVTADGNGSITDRGICWGTSINPTTANSTYSNGAGSTGAFTSPLVSLSANPT